ncbi:MAG: hypothetical protein M1832_000941 [Thelocarpon impressellum]|nr:MAG: hypothetical protein M1832_000941 [Thelocarpon impressellum]
MERVGVLVGEVSAIARRGYFASPNETAVYGDLPAGVRSNFVNPVSKADQLIVVNAICIPICLALVLARLYSKIRVTHNLGWDDYTCVIGFAFALFNGGCSLASVGQWAYLCNFYWISVAASKSSILLLYLRIFGNSKLFRWHAWAMIGFVNALCFACMMAVLFQCLPVRSNWTIVENSKCINNKNIAVSASALNLFQDFIILVMPIPVVKTLQLPTKQRTIIVLLFLTGLIATVVTAVRFYTLIDGGKEEVDYSWATFGIYLWTNAELYVFVMVACLPLMKTFLRNVFPKIFVLSHHSTTGSTSKSSSHFSAWRLWPMSHHSARKESSPSETHSASQLVARSEKAHVVPAPPVPQMPEPHVAVPLAAQRPSTARPGGGAYGEAEV